MTKPKQLPSRGTNSRLTAVRAAPQSNKVSKESAHSTASLFRFLTLLTVRKLVVDDKGSWWSSTSQIMHHRVSESLIQDLIRELRNRPLAVNGHHVHQNGHANGHHHHVNPMPASVTPNTRRRTDIPNREQPSSSTEAGLSSSRASSGAASQVAFNAKELERTKNQLRQLQELLASLDGSQTGQPELGHLWANARPNDLNGHQNHMMNGYSSHGHDTANTALVAQNDHGFGLNMDSLIRNMAVSIESMNEMTRNMLHRTSSNNDGNQQLITLLLMQNQQLIHQQQQLLLFLSLNHNNVSTSRHDDHTCCASSTGQRRLADHLQRPNQTTYHSFPDNEQSSSQLQSNYFVDNVSSQHTMPSSQSTYSYQTNMLSSVKRPACSPNLSDSGRPTTIPSNPSSAKLQLNNQVTPGVRANNYYDNFRSNTCQNQLSGSSRNEPNSVTSMTPNFASNVPASNPENILANQLQDSLRLMDVSPFTSTSVNTSSTSNHNFHFEAPVDLSSGSNNQRHHPFALVPPLRSLSENANAFHRKQKKAANHTKARVVANPWEMPSNSMTEGAAGPSVLSLEKIIEKFMTEDKSVAKNQVSSGKKANNIASATNQLDSLGAVGGAVAQELDFLLSPSSGAVRKRPRSNTASGVFETTSYVNGDLSATSTVTSSNSSSVHTSINNRGDHNQLTLLHPLVVPDPSPNPGEEVEVPVVNPAQCMRELSSKLRTWQESLSSIDVNGDVDSSSNETTFIVVTPGSQTNNLDSAVSTTVSTEADNPRRSDTATVVSEEDNKSPVASSSKPCLPNPSSPLTKNAGAETGESGQEEEVDTDGRGYEQDDEDEEEEDDEDEISFQDEGGEQGL